MGKTVLHGADPKSFAGDLLALDIEGFHSHPTFFSCDRTSVYVYGKRINGADPTTFGMLRKSNGIIGFDKARAWQDSGQTFEQLHLTSNQLQQLRAELDSARAARRARSAATVDHGRAFGSCVVSSH